MKRERVVDMSPDAIAQRLRDLEELFLLGMSLRLAKRPAEPTPAPPR